MRFSKINGFTLVELLVVIAIIGILSSLSVVSLNSARGRARDAQRYNDLRQLFTAMTLYYDTQVSTPQYPSMSGSEEDKWTSDNDTASWWNGIAGPNRFFPTVLKDPGIGNTSAYSYAVQAETSAGKGDLRQHYCVYTKLEGADNYLIVTESGLKSKEGTPEFTDNSTVCDCTPGLCAEAGS